MTTLKQSSMWIPTNKKLSAEKAISKPSNSSTVKQNTTNHIINNMMPITDAHLQEHVQNLNPIHVQNGASGYAKYALEYPLKDMIVCTDFQRRNCKYKYLTFKN
jgi:hypothetical protein